MAMSETTKFQSNILFVDDDELILNSYRRSFRAQKSWKVFYASSAKEAMQIIDREDIALIVSDMLMPAMTGNDLFKILKQSHPHITRILLSAHISQNVEEVNNVIENSHVFLSKPCNHKELISHIFKYLSLKSFIHDDQLKLTLEKIEKLPCLKQNYLELVELLQDPDCEIADIVKIVELDLAMTSKILQLVNSSFFYSNTKIISVEQAIKFLGLDAIKHFVLAAKIFDMFASDKIFHRKISELWSEGLYCKKLLKQIGEFEKMAPELINSAGLAAMLHDIGQLIFCSSYFNDYPEIQNLMAEDSIDVCQAERKISGITHPQLGAYFLGFWGLPEEITHAIFIHHDLGAQDFSYFNSAMLVYSANFYWNLIKTPEYELSPKFNEFKRQINLNHPNRFEQWLKIAKEAIVDEYE